MCLSERTDRSDQRVHSLTLPPSLSRSQYRQFVPHGRRSGPSHGVAGQRDDGRAERRTARGAAVLTPPSPPPIACFSSQNNWIGNTVYKENIYITSIFVKGCGSNDAFKI